MGPFFVWTYSKRGAEITANVHSELCIFSQKSLDEYTHASLYICFRSNQLQRLRQSLTSHGTIPTHRHT